MSTKSSSADASPASPPSGGTRSDDAPRVHVTPTKTPVYRVPQGRKKKDGFIHNRACIERRMKPGKPGTPRYQRYLNQRFLADLQAQLSDSEDDASVDMDEQDVLANDFIEQEESFFAGLFDPRNPIAMKVWEPFLDIDLDEQDRQMAELSSSVPLSTSPLSNMPKQHAVPPRFWEPLQRCARNATYYMLLCSLESHVVHYLDLICEGLRATSEGGASDGADAWARMMGATFVDAGCENRLGAHVAVDANKYPHLCFGLGDSYQRLLCHAVCAYYMLQSESENAADGRRLTAVRLRQTPKLVAATTWQPSYPKQLLAHYVVASAR